MNANELADELEKRHLLGGYASEAATMLRQQQAEIEALKQIIDANNLNQNIGQFVKPTNEPVAWMEYIQGEEWEVWFVEPTDLPDGHTYEPLYTHPVKELTDKEILGVWKENSSSGELYYDLLEFARAILRKAQEK